MDLQLIGDRLRLFTVRFYPFLFLLFVVGIWKFNLWSYLDYLILAFVVFILRGVTLDFSLVRKFGLGYLFGTKRYTEFHERVIEGDSAWVKNYLERGGDPNFQSADGVPPLYLAIVNGHFETVKVLVEQGADINLTTPKSYADLSPVFVAAWKKQDEIMEFLLEQGAITNIYFSALTRRPRSPKKICQ